MFYRTMQCRRARYFQSVDSVTVRFLSANYVTAVIKKGRGVDNMMQSSRKVCFLAVMFIAGL